MTDPATTTRDPLTVLREMAYELCGDDNGTTHPKCREIFDTVAALTELEQRETAWCKTAHRSEETAKTQRQRAEAAERERDQALKDAADYLRHLHAAERERDRLREARDRLVKNNRAALDERDQLADKLDTSRAYLKATQKEADQLADTLREIADDYLTVPEVARIARAALDRHTQAVGE